MCLAIPCKVMKIKEKKAEIQTGDHRHWIDLSLLKNIKVGDYLLVHGDLAINKVSETEAKKIIKMVTGNQ